VKHVGLRKTASGGAAVGLKKKVVHEQHEQHERQSASNIVILDSRAADSSGICFTASDK
jgi:hypothetical protein